MRDPVDANKVGRFLEELGAASRGEGRVFLMGGASAVLLGWRPSTIDIDLKFSPEPAGVFERIPALKSELNLNIELASPDDFVPALPGWEARCLWIARHGDVDFHHFDFYTQALSKVERDHVKDRADVANMIAANLVDPVRLLALFDELPPESLARYPSLEPDEIRENLARLADEHA